MSILLPKGITGFGETPGFNLSLLKQILVYPYRIAKIEPPEAHCNYFKVSVIHQNTAPIILLFNCVHPYCCRIADGSSWMNLHFIDLPEGLVKILKADFYVLSKEQLENPASEEQLQALDSKEMEQIQYWEPKRLGDIVFNGFD